MAGLFLSLDGIDGTGKSTQCRLLAAWLREQGREVVEAVDPGGTPLGQEIRQILLAGKHELDPRCEALLFMASRAQLVATVIRPALERRAVVVCDRFLLANVVYQGYGGGLDVEQLWTVGELSTGGLRPAQTYILDMTVEDAQRRRGRTADRIETRDRDYHERVRQGFLKEARRRGYRVIDAYGEVESIQAQIRTDVTGLLRDWDLL
jgi:dTMP kinase